MTFKPVAKEIKDQILYRVKQGIPVSQLAKEHGIHVRTIYGWLSKISRKAPSALEVGRLKRENDDLLKIIGGLTLELTKSKKNKSY
jgi:transposase-like protein